MAVLFSLNSRKVKAGRVIDNQPVAVPAGVAAVAWTVTVGDPANPGPEDIAAWIEWNDGGTWREFGRFVAFWSCDGTGQVDARGDGLRFSLTCGQTTTVSATVVSI